jgi:hypothetical protein
LVQIPIDTAEVTVGVLARTNDIINFFNPIVNGIPSFKSEFSHENASVRFEGLVIKVYGFVVNDGVVIICSRFFKGSGVKGLTHSSMNKGVANGIVAHGAFGHSNVINGVVNV